MIDSSSIRQCEIDLYAHHARKVTTPFGCLYYNPDNLSSYDSNHAHITRFDDIGLALSVCEAFYAEKCVRPRIFFFNDDAGFESLLAMLQKKGWKTEKGDMRVMEYCGGRDLQPQTELQVRRISVIDEAVKAIFLENDGGGDWNYGVVRDCLEHGRIQVFVGYAGESPAAVTCLDHDEKTGLSLIHDVFTAPSFRGLGYARDMIRHTLAAQSPETLQNLYLWVENPIAVRVYTDTGFAYAPLGLEEWSAWKE